MRFWVSGSYGMLDRQATGLFIVTPGRAVLGKFIQSIV